MIKGECIKVDVAKVLIDTENEEDLPSGDERMEKCRYMLNNCGIGVHARATKTAVPFKKWFGTKSYEAALLWESIGTRTDSFEFFVDGVGVQDHAIDTNFIMISNSMFIGWGYVL